MAHVTLRDALVGIGSNTSKERTDGLTNLKYILRHNQRSSRVDSLGDSSFYKILDVLFDAARSEQTSLAKAKTPATRTTCSNRLSDVASALRHSVEAGVRVLRYGTAKAVLDHVCSTIWQNGNLCEPLALDYAKAMRAVLSFQPHVEHMNVARDHTATDWTHYAEFCILCIKQAENGQIEEDGLANGDPISTAATVRSASYRSSRSAVRESASSQNTRSVTKALADEMVGCARLLTAAPNAPMREMAVSLLSTLIGALQRRTISSRVHSDAFVTINYLVSWSRTEDVVSTHKVLSSLVRLVKQCWSTKSSATSHMLVTLLLLRPFMSNAMQRSTGIALRGELEGLLHTLTGEYYKRQDREQIRQLSLDDIRLEINDPNTTNGRVTTTLFTLRSSGIRAESNWLLVYMVASIHKLLIRNGASPSHEDKLPDHEGEYNSQRPQKRQRTQDSIDLLIDGTTKGLPQSRSGALQVLAFLNQQVGLTSHQLSQTLDALAASCAEENGTISSWAFLCVAACAAQPRAMEFESSGRWSTLWRLASRAVSNASSCRAASYALHTMIRLRLVPRTDVNELVQIVSRAMDLSGPSQFSDAVTMLLNSVLEVSQQTNPDAASLTADSIITWLSHTFLPSKFENLQYCGLGYDSADIVTLINACLKQRPHPQKTAGFAVWDTVARAWVMCDGDKELVSYLLLNPEESSNATCSEALLPTPEKSTVGQLSKTSSEGLVLTSMSAELTRIIDAWKASFCDGRRQPSTDAFAMLCKGALAFTCLASCSHYRDTRRQTQVRDQAIDLLNLLADFVANPLTDQEKVDLFLSLSSTSFSRVGTLHGRMTNYGVPACEKHVCQIVQEALSRRQALLRISGDDDPMEMDDMEDSQESRNAGALVKATAALTTDFDLAFGHSTVRSGAALYATALLAVDKELDARFGTVSASGKVTDYILAQTADVILSSRDVLAALPNLGLIFNARDTERLMDFFTSHLVQKYPYAMSEAALSTVLDVMFSLIPVWTDRKNDQLYDFGVQIYEWFVMTALPGAFLSGAVLKRLTKLLLRLFQSDECYPRTSESASPEGREAVPSPYTALFQKLMVAAPIPVMFDLANQAAEVFGMFVLSQHDRIFTDLKDHLPTDPDGIEGLAMRLLFLSKLGSAWRSLLRQCVYYMFDTAGHIHISSDHATHCIGQLANSLKLGTSRRLFELFAPQLLHTWLDDNSTLADLPYAAFGYKSLHELLRLNQSEVLAQLTVRSDEPGMDLMVKTLGTDAGDAVELSYAKCVAYCIGRDIVEKPTGTVPNAREASLRQRIGGKAVHNAILRDRFAVVVGYFFLTTQEDDVEDSWLQKRDGYNAPAKALAEIKSYSYSDRQLPETQQPSFKSKYLVDELERLCRRLGITVLEAWTPSSFALTARMLLDAVDDSLGSLHSCLMIRRLRTFLVLAGDVATDGFGLEMIVHSLRTFVTDGECADDTLGVLQYLLNHGRGYLRRNNLRFATGAIVLLVLKIRKHCITQHDSTTQESQHTATVRKMKNFHEWLVKYLPSLTKDEKHCGYRQLQDAIGSLQLPGNSRSGSAESSLLLFLLDQWRSAEPLLSNDDCIECLQLLSEDFQKAPLLGEDCLGEDAAAHEYSQPLWEVLQETALSDKFVAWAAGALGRSYASTGLRPVHSANQDLSNLRHISKPSDGSTVKSRATIINQLCKTLYSRTRAEAGLADFTLRKIQDAFTINSQVRGDTSEVEEYHQQLPDAIYSTVSDGTCAYEPAAVSRHAQIQLDDGALIGALAVSQSETFELWTTQLAKSICEWATNDEIVSSLTPLVENIPSLAMNLLPSMIHLLLVKEHDTSSSLRSALSDALNAHMAVEDAAQCSKQRFFLKLLLYLRSQPFPVESTQADRLRWLEVDFLAAAGAASRCGMPACALMLAESTVPATQVNRRSSSKATASQPLLPEVPDELKLSIYKQMEEPDSFYGVSQPASLDSVMSRLDHEADGFRSLMFRSAQMDSHMRHMHKLPESDAIGMAQSLSALSFNSLAFALVTRGTGDIAGHSDQMLQAAQALQQWDVPIPELLNDSSLTFSVFQELSRANDVCQLRSASQNALLAQVKQGLALGKTASPSHSWHGALATLTEVEELLASENHTLLTSRWQVMQDREHWMHMARFEDVKTILSNRQTVFGVIRQNGAIQKALHLTAKECYRLEVEALLECSKLAREHHRLQEALAATTALSDMVNQCKSVSLIIEGVVKCETASVLWYSGDSTTSVKMLQDTLNMDALEQQDLNVGRSGLLAQLGHQLSNARLEKPEEILRQYLKPAVAQLTSKNSIEAGNVFHEFATFCDNELQNPSNIENLNRIVKLRQGREEEVEAIVQAQKLAKGAEAQAAELEKSARSHKAWLRLEQREEVRLKNDRKMHVNLSLQYYLQALQASNKHDISVLRFFALWLENTDDGQADATVKHFLKEVPSWKFVRLMNQLMSRVEEGSTPFQTALQHLIRRIFKDHPFHSYYHLIAAREQPSGKSAGDFAAQSRFRAAHALAAELANDTQNKDLFSRVHSATQRYKALAVHAVTAPKNATKLKLSASKQAEGIASSIPNKRLPPITMTVPLRASGNYNDVPVIVRFEDQISIMGGLSAPKMLKAYASDGKQYKELFKSGKDDLRQDAIMEQVFEEVSKMLHNHKATRQRDLKVRTYKVIPLTKTCGVIEFVPNSIPINEYLRPAHRRYHPGDISDTKARELIHSASSPGGSFEERLKTFRQICSKMSPVMRHFFFERYNDPDEWFDKRTAYTRTTASVSILGHVLGLGDRHCSNILLDEKTGECVHIDLGVAFEQGRVLPIPELIPFRLTRDIVDGMGSTKTEGVFRRCCEFTLDAVREDKDSIMTLLNVLRYDPLYEWSVSPLRAKRMQEAQATGRNGGDMDESSSKRKEHTAGEAERALAIVEKKLSKNLSTTATVNELIQQATDEKNLAVLFQGWAAFY